MAGTLPVVVLDNSQPTTGVIALPKVVLDNSQPADGTVRLPVAILGTPPTVWVPTGGFQFGGAAIIVGDPFIPTGGVKFGGAATVSAVILSISDWYPTGGIKFGGSAPSSFNFIQYTPSGGIKFGGAAVVSSYQVPPFLPTGGIQFGGAATVSTVLISAYAANMVAPAFVTTGTITPGIAATGNLVAQRFTVSGSIGQEKYSLTAARFSTSGSIVVGAAATGNLVAKRFTTYGAISIAPNATGNLVAQRFTATGLIQTGATATGSLVAKRFTLSGTIAAGLSATGSLIAQRFTTLGLITYAISATGNLVAQRFATLGLIDGSTPAWLSFVMNSSHFGVTEYQNYRFNSFATLNGHTLGASDSGLFLLEGDNDAGTSINASVTTGIYDFESLYKKRATDAFLGYDCAGELEFSVTQADKTYRYKLPKKSGLSMHKRNLGQGAKHQYHQYGVRNVAGAPFTLDQFRVLVNILPRHQ